MIFLSSTVSTCHKQHLFRTWKPAWRGSPPGGSDLHPPQRGQQPQGQECGYPQPRSTDHIHPRRLVIEILEIFFLSSGSNSDVSGILGTFCIYNILQDFMRAFQNCLIQLGQKVFTKGRGRGVSSPSPFRENSRKLRPQE